MRRALSSPHYTDGLCLSDERQGKEGPGFSTDAGLRSHHRHEPYAAVPPGCCLLPDGVYLSFIRSLKFVRSTHVYVITILT